MRFWVFDSDESSPNSGSTSSSTGQSWDDAGNDPRGSSSQSSCNYVGGGSDRVSSESCSSVANFKKTDDMNGQIRITMSNNQKDQVFLENNNEQDAESCCASCEREEEEYTDIRKGAWTLEEDAILDFRRGPWSVEEDAILINYINIHGEGHWNSAARCAGLKRTGKSCRLRWLRLKV
ncbi:hypothetical protein JCGZ_24976 [Jatropha curcas]|uniref:Uncharacterized protein n=1 Tax=Jatropha curcas TaxID=180498 RepID=A0A067KXU2_JATCU|nr:uncharacterized protein LOC110009244 [Jatropha curcas]KDP40977.1 hypothetical protein JCGZ_24976 [Jatropha curcas]